MAVEAPDGLLWFWIGTHAELLALIALAAKTNHLATALQVPVDGAFDQGANT